MRGEKSEEEERKRERKEQRSRRPSPRPSRSNYCRDQAKEKPEFEREAPSNRRWRRRRSGFVS